MTRLAAAAVAVAAAVGTGCHNDPSPGPAPSPTPTQAQIVATALPTPLVATPEVAGATVRYRITANLTFREVAGFAATVTLLRVTITLSSGQSTNSSYAVSVPVAASGTASYLLQQTVELPGNSGSGKWRLDTSGTGPGTTPLACAPVEADLSIVPPQAVDAILAGAGDIARCPDLVAAETAKLLDAIPGTVFTSGDNVYPYGSADLYQNCYAPTWGRHLWRTYATPGNHDWDSGASASYLAYFGPAAAPNGLTYYTYSLGSWDVIAMNSNIAMTAGSAQYEWLRGVLAASTKQCVMAIWHHPLFTSSINGNSTWVRDAWRVLYQYGVDIVVNGHDHVYERFAPQDPNGAPSSRGIREFVIGTGGDTLYDRKTYPANSEVFENKTFGVLKLTLKSGSYDWEFVPIAGQSFRDAGSGQCVTPALR